VTARPFCATLPLSRDVVPSFAVMSDYYSAYYRSFYTAVALKTRDPKAENGEPLQEGTLPTSDSFVPPVHSGLDGIAHVGDRGAA
jgi:hypothetical protein